MPTVTRRRNGIVRVPKLWLDATVEAFEAMAGKTASGTSMVIPLPLKVFPYPKIREALKAIYPQKFVPLTVVNSAGPGLGSAAGATSTKHDGGYRITLSFRLKGAEAVSTILHELRHLVQHLGDEVVKTASGTFGRPSRAATRSLRARKKAIKSGAIKVSHKHAAYFASASEWQPWVGSTADKIVSKIVDGNITKTAEVNAAIREGILSSTFYTLNDPATRNELMKQVYKEIMRQLRGYTDIIPAQHPTAIAHKKKKAHADLMVKGIQEATASAIAAFGQIDAIMKGKAKFVPNDYVVITKIEGAAPSIANEPNYDGKDSSGRDKLVSTFDYAGEAVQTAQDIAAQAKKGATFHGGTVYAVRVKVKSQKKEAEIYKKNPRRTRRAPRRRTR
jgi:hypothetical protein